MNDEIKEILDKLRETADYPKLNYSSYDKSYNETIDNVAMIKSFACKQLLDYITNLQQENEKLINLVKEFENKGYDIGQERADFLLEIKDLQQEIKDLQQEIEKLNDDKRGMLVQLYKANDNRDKVKQENEELKKELENKCWDEASVRADILLEQEDYKSRCEKANNQLKIIMQILKEQPTRNIEDDEWLENRLIAVANILQNGSDSQ